MAKGKSCSGLPPPPASPPIVYWQYRKTRTRTDSSVGPPRPKGTGLVIRLSPALKGRGFKPVCEFCAIAYIVWKGSPFLLYNDPKPFLNNHQKGLVLGRMPFILLAQGFSPG